MRYIVIKEDIKVSTSKFLEDLMDNNLNPYELCDNEEDAYMIEKAVRLIKDFRLSCVLQIDNFIQ